MSFSFTATTRISLRRVRGLGEANGQHSRWARLTYTPTTAPGKRRREAEEPQGDGGLAGINVPPRKEPGAGLLGSSCRTQSGHG